MWNSLCYPVRHGIFLAQTEAEREKSGWVLPKHLAIGMLLVNGNARRCLTAKSVNADALVEQLRSLAIPESAPKALEELTLHSDGKRAIDIAFAESRKHPDSPKSFWKTITNRLDPTMCTADLLVGCIRSDQQFASILQAVNVADSDLLSYRNENGIEPTDPEIALAKGFVAVSSSPESEA